MRKFRVGTIHVCAHTHNPLYTIMSNVSETIKLAKTLTGERVQKMMAEADLGDEQLRDLLIAAVLAVNQPVVRWLLANTRANADWIPLEKFPKIMVPMMRDIHAGPSLMKHLAHHIDFRRKLGKTDERPRETLGERMRAAGLNKHADWLAKYV